MADEPKNGNYDGALSTMLRNTLGVVVAAALAATLSFWGQQDVATTLARQNEEVAADLLRLRAEVFSDTREQTQRLDRDFERTLERLERALAGKVDEQTRKAMLDGLEATHRHLNDRIARLETMLGPRAR